MSLLGWIWSEFGEDYTERRFNFRYDLRHSSAYNRNLCENHLRV